MAIFKKSIIIILCAILAFSPLLYCGDFSYADSNPWLAITDEKTWTAAVRSYVKFTRGFNNICADALSDDELTRIIAKFDYGVYKKACEALGYDPEDLQRQTKYRIMGNGNYQFLYENSILGVYNALWAKILEEEGLIDSENINTLVYSGKLFTDTEGNSCLVYVMNRNYNDRISDSNISQIAQYGTPLKYSLTDLMALAPNLNDEGKTQFIINGHTYGKNGTSSTGLNDDTFKVKHLVSNRFKKNTNIEYLTTYDTYWAYTSIPYNTDPIINTNPHYSIFAFNNNVYSIGIIHFNYMWEYSDSSRYQLCNYSAASDDIKQQLVNANVHAKREKFGNGPADDSGGNDVALDTGKDDIDDIFTDPDYDPTPVDDVPTIPPTDPTQPNPTGGNVDPEDGDVNWHMPDLHVDWDLGDFTDIFPFSIPYDIIELFDIVDSEPVTPSIYQEVDFGAFNYTIDFDLSYFDEFMEYVRAMELFLYTLTLFIATRGIFKIY